jgi:hypothetical protein
MRTLFYAFAAILLVSSLANAQAISPSEVVNNWIDSAEPMHTNLQHVGWSVQGSEVRTPDYGMRLSNFTQEGGSFKGSFRTTGNDDDVIGFVFGFQDSDNHYRFAWDAFDNNNGHQDPLGTNGVNNSVGLSGGPGGTVGANGGVHGLPTGQAGVHGIRLIKEENGVISYLYQDPAPSGAQRWKRNTLYDFSISRNNNQLSFSIVESGVGPLVDVQVTDSTYTTGNIGVFASSQSPIFFSNLKAVAVPEPSSVVLIALGGLFLFLRNKRK